MCPHQVLPEMKITNILVQEPLWLWYPVIIHSLPQFLDCQ